ncbi:MAG: hypothetical protein HFE54_02400 [Turicibacter sp.]|mgnify:FL=1|uniref:Uncharacterized protein n=1 Tax=Turicibacter faecis TaxID=2963365 RepID=A0ABN6ZAK2_9FIRM|nr:hypothetical protein [Turicibacter sp. TA25]MCI8702595.1 hypothetical protein [Turicibacter sp.]MCI9350772.1 hypothetical protein [Turicibacter sp.]MCU7204838.1 hypothetical protein [Turicibacter sp. TA25]BEH90621.1 hypothetical protein T23_07230 [Turicibacter sp. TC023]
MYDRPRFNRRNPYSFLRGYRENHEGGFDPNFVPVPYPGEFGGLGSFIVGGLAGAFLASAFGNKHDQAAHPAQATTSSVQPVIQPVPVVQGMPYNYSPYGYMSPTSQLKEPKVKEKDDDEELYPDFDEWKGKQPVKETHQVYTIPNQATSNKMPTYQQAPMYQQVPVYQQAPVYYQPMMPAYQVMQQSMMPYPSRNGSARWITTDVSPYQESSGPFMAMVPVVTHQVALESRPATQVMPYYMMPVQQSPLL